MPIKIKVPMARCQMAARSNTSGIITCTAYDKNVVKVLCRVLESAKSNFSFETKRETRIKSTEDGYQATLSFSGVGEDNFLRNLEGVSQLLEAIVLQSQMIEELELLQSNEWKLFFNFSDENADDYMLYEALAVIEHEANTNISKAEFSLVDKRDYCPTWGNMLKICGYELDWILDSIEGMDKKEIASQISDNLDSLCFYYDCCLQELFEQQPRLSKMFTDTISKIV